jgi:hypothetical protein
MEKVYHIYAKDKCIFHSLKEEQFKTTWNTLKSLIKVLDTHYVGEDLSYEELIVNKEIVRNSSY